MSKDLAAVSPETLDEVHERITINVLTAAIQAGFNPHGQRDVTIKQVIDACAIVIRFLEAAVEQAPMRTMADWAISIGDLNVTLGKSKE